MQFFWTRPRADTACSVIKTEVLLTAPPRDQGSDRAMAKKLRGSESVPTKCCCLAERMTQLFSRCAPKFISTASHDLLPFPSRASLLARQTCHVANIFPHTLPDTIIPSGHCAPTRVACPVLCASRHCPARATE